MSRMLDEKEAAEQIGCTFHTLRKWRLLGKGPRYHKVGRLVRYSETEKSSNDTCCVDHRSANCGQYEIADNEPNSLCPLHEVVSLKLTSRRRYSLAEPVHSFGFLPSL